MLHETIHTGSSTDDIECGQAVENLLILKKFITSARNVNNLFSLVPLVPVVKLFVLHQTVLMY